MRNCEILDKPEGASYYMGCRKVITNLRKWRTVYACVTAAAPEKQADEKIRSYSAWGMLPLGLFSLQWNIETSYYETKTNVAGVNLTDIDEIKE